MAINVSSQENEQEFKQLLFTRDDDLIDDTMPDNIPHYVRNYYYNEKDNNYFVMDVFRGNLFREGYSTIEPSVGITGIFKQNFTYETEPFKECVIWRKGSNLITVGEYAKNEVIGEWTDYYDDGSVSRKGFYDHESNRIGSWKSWYSDGQIRDDEHYENGKLHGKCLYYFENGQISSEETYKNGKLINYKLFDEAGNVVKNRNYKGGIIMPIYKGGTEAIMAFLKKNLIYPKQAERKKVYSSTVVVQFVVKSNGELSDFKITRGIRRDFNEEALRVVKKMQGNWIAGVENNRKVDILFNLPIVFN